MPGRSRGYVETVVAAGVSPVAALRSKAMINALARDISAGRIGPRKALAVVDRMVDRLAAGRMP